MHSVKRDSKTRKVPLATTVLFTVSKFGTNFELEFGVRGTCA